MAGKSKRKVYRLRSKETGEHYTVRLSRVAHEGMKTKGGMNKFSRKERKHMWFELTKEVKK